MTGFDSWQG